MNYTSIPILYTYFAHGAETAVLRERTNGVHRGALVVLDIGDIADCQWAKLSHRVAITHTHRHTQMAYISVWVPRNTHIQGVYLVVGATKHR
jgi:hypothetical protein